MEKTELILAGAELNLSFGEFALATCLRCVHPGMIFRVGAMVPETPQLTRFSSDDIPEHQRDEFIRDFYGRIQMRLQIKPNDYHPLRFAASTLIFPGMMLTKGSVSPMNWHRTTDLMADGNDDIVLSWNRGGYRFTMPGQGDCETRPGTAAILPMDRRFSITSADSRWTMALQFKRSVLAPLIRNLDDVRADAIGRSNPAHNLLFNYLWSLLHIDSAATLGPLVGRHITDLLAVSFGSVEQHAQISGVRAARLNAIKQHIARNLHDPKLSAEQVSHRFAISARYIRQIFAEEGTSFSGYVTEQRLAHVHNCLTDRRQILRRIADIAFEVGFTEPSTFYRQFRIHYGMTPTEARLLGQEIAQTGKEGVAGG